MPTRHGQHFCLCSSCSPALGVEEAPSDGEADIRGRKRMLCCNETSPCSNGACCGKSGFCGYGATYCGTSGESPNEACWSNCDAHAECGKDSLSGNATCPLNVCCSQYGFCGTTEEFCGPGCQNGCDVPGSGATNGSSQSRIIGYYESWANGKQCMGMNIQQIPVESLTHLNYAFGYISPGSYEIGPMPDVDASTFSDFTALKSKNSNLVVGISLGGWTFNDNKTTTQPVFGEIVSSPKNRKTFINNLISFMRHYGFDAVDIDWEYPGAPDRQPNQKDSDKDGANYVLLMQEIRAAFDKQPEKFVLSFTAPTSYWYLRWFDIGKMAEAVDFVNFMTYDLHGIWDSDNPIGSQVLAHTNLTEIEQALELLWRNDVSPAKVNLGLAFYSRTFQLEDRKCTTPGCPFKGGAVKGACTKNSGTLSYSEITDVLASHNITPIYDEVAGVKYFTWNEDQWASFDDQQTFQQKITFADSQGLGGLLIWSVDQDDRNLDALRGVLYPKDVKAQNDLGLDVSYWESQQPGDCETTECGGSCSAGTIEITTLKCPKGGHEPQKLCCPLASAPDPSTCQWRGGPGLCNGQCHGGEVALASSKNGGNGHCTDGRQFYCCPIPEVADGAGINCGWKDKCSSDQTLMTFAGTFLEDLSPIASLAGLFGKALEEALDGLDIEIGKRYCCGKEEAKNWKDCYWAGSIGRSFNNCDDNHCNTGHEVELTTSFFGEGETCAPMYKRQRAFCCTPASGKSPFMPVPLEYLFPDPPGTNIADPVFNLEVDDSWGTGKDKGKDDPNDAAFGFVVITAPSEVSNEDEHTVRIVCTDHSSDSRCADIHLGDGVPGTILQMPAGCGPELTNAQIYDLKFDYDFRRVPRSYGDSQMRIDFSNEEGYWDAVVDRPGQTRKKKRDLVEIRQNRRRWLEDEWREAYHNEALSREELHKRWFGADAIAWLANLIGIGQAEATVELNHHVDETLEIILIDEQYGPCPFGPASVEASIRATLQANVQVDTSFGITIIVTLGSPLDLSNSYLYFKNKGKVTAQFQVDAVASVNWNSGDIKLIGLDNFPGATFRVPGVVTLGPNMAVYASADAAVTLSAHLQAEVNIVSWDIQQTYPQTNQYPMSALDSPNYDGTQTLKSPSVDASVSAVGELALHLKPKVTFGIVFDDRWDVPDCSVDLVLDGFVIFHAEAGLSTESSNSCPFSYGIDAGANVYGQLNAPSFYNWGGTKQVPIASVPRKQITPDTCAGASTSSKRSLDLPDELANASVSETTVASSVRRAHGILFDDVSTDGASAGLGLLGSSLQKRDTFSLGPIITVPDSSLSCPGENVTGCLLCDSYGGDTTSLKIRDLTEIAEACPWIPTPDSACTDGDLDKRARHNPGKNMALSWSYTFEFATYPPCSAGNLNSVSSISKWYMPRDVTSSGCDPTVVKFNKDNGAATVNKQPIFKQFANDHIFEIQLISDFLEWLCNTNDQNKYGGVGVIGFISGWQQADATWCAYVFGLDTLTGGFEFPLDAQDNEPSNFLANAATKVGGDDHPELMALLWSTTNAAKGVWVGGGRPDLNNVPDTPRGLAEAIQTSASVFDYLNMPYISNAWRVTSNGIEAVCDAFDRNFWGSAYAAAAPGTPLQGPPSPNGVTSWGLRTAWCFWIDNHLARIETNVAAWIANAKTRLQAKTGGSSQLASRFIAAYMGANGLASASRMHFYREPNFATTPLPGTMGSARTTTSRYGMWGNNGLGRLGV
ncbi:hypothetical protein BDW68DRAFT_193691 [Aspergillus falconensis]